VVTVRDATFADLQAVTELIQRQAGTRTTIEIARSRAGTAIRLGQNRKAGDICLVAVRGETVVGWLYAQEIAAFDLCKGIRLMYVPFLIGQARPLLRGLRERTRLRILLPVYDGVTKPSAALTRLLKSAGMEEGGTIWIG